MKNMTKVNVGLDVGISSAGWSVINAETNQILESGVRLFSGSDADENVNRRNQRQGRRLFRRRKLRIQEAKKYLENVFQLKDIEPKDEWNPYEIRVRALNEKVSKEELSIALLNIVKHRGISYELEDVTEEEGTNTQSFQSGLDYNRRLLKTKTVGEIQYERLQKYGQVRGQIQTEDGLLINIFPTKNYVEEVEQILETQKKYHSEIDDVFIEKIISFVTRKREYFVGPGNEKSRIDYGIYRENGETLDNLFEILIGKDKFYPEEYRAAGSSYTAQIFNLLNDLNNLRIPTTEDHHLTKAQKEEIITELKNTSRLSGGMLKLISKVTKAPKEEISGYRKDEKDKPDLHSLAYYRKQKNMLEKEGIQIADFSEELLDELATMMTLNTEPGEIRKQLNKMANQYDILTPEVIEVLVKNHTAFVATSNHKWHRFSLKLMKEFIPELLETSKEQSTILCERGFIQSRASYLDENHHFNYVELRENLYNPVVRKSTCEMLKVFTAIQEKYPNIQNVIVELPRETNEDEQKRKIKKINDNNAKRKKEILKEAQAQSGLSEEALEEKLLKTKGLYLKLMLWYEQEGKCVYSGQEIPLSDLLQNKGGYEVDHIIPISISFDDRLCNKVLVRQQLNSQKSNQTPFEYMTTHTDGHLSFHELKELVGKNKRFSKEKRELLLAEIYSNDIETRKRFINRNLVDTSYTARIVLNALQQYKKENQLSMNVSVVRGAMTNILRKKVKLDKTRETFHHHAIDASLMAVIPNIEFFKERKEWLPKSANEEVVEVEVSEEETMPEKEFKVKMCLPETFIQDVQTLQRNSFAKEEVSGPQTRERNLKIKFSHQVDQKMNRKVADDTIYGTRQAQLGKDKKEETYVIGKIKDIYNYDEYVRFKKRYDKNKESFLMYHHDPQTFEKLEEILAQYPEYIEDEKGKKKKVSPFALYREENGPVTKYAKKNNGPVIKQLKYYDSKLNRKIDISHKYSTKNRQVVLQSLKPYRTDVYRNQDTGEYTLVGIDQNDGKFVNGHYGIPKSRYEEIKVNNKLSERDEFVFSLYKNSMVKAIDENGESIVVRYLSRSMPKQKNYAEIKPVEKYQFEDGEVVSLYGKCRKQMVTTFVKKGWTLLKGNTDILGNTYFVEKESENPKKIIDDK